MNSLLCRTVLSQNTKSCMVVKRANSFLVRSSKVPNGPLPLICQTRTIISGSSLNRKEKLTFEEQELKNKEMFAWKCSSRTKICLTNKSSEHIKDSFILHVISCIIFSRSWILVGPPLPGVLWICWDGWFNTGRNNVPCVHIRSDCCIKEFLVRVKRTWFVQSWNNGTDLRTSNCCSFQGFNNIRITLEVHPLSRIYYRQCDRSLEFHYWCTVEEDKRDNQRSTFSIYFLLSLTINIKIGL